MHYKGVKINIVDTPGHADFGGEVERVLKMVDGVLLLVDAFEGPMPQTRFVLQQGAGARTCTVIIVINKIDRPDARCDEVVRRGARPADRPGRAPMSSSTAPIVFAPARARHRHARPAQVPANDLRPLFDTILKYIPAPEGDPDAPAADAHFHHRLQRLRRPHRHRPHRPRHAQAGHDGRRCDYGTTPISARAAACAACTRSTASSACRCESATRGRYRRRLRL